MGVAKPHEISLKTIPMSLGSINWFIFGPRKRVLPEIKPLMEALNKFYTMLGLQPANEHLYREAWGMKAACGLVKRKGRRQELTKETWLNLTLSTVELVWAQLLYSIVSRVEPPH